MSSTFLKGLCGADFLFLLSHQEEYLTLLPLTLQWHLDEPLLHFSHCCKFMLLHPSPPAQWELLEVRHSQSALSPQYVAQDLALGVLRRRLNKIVISRKTSLSTSCTHPAIQTSEIFAECLLCANTSQTLHLRHEQNRCDPSLLLYSCSYLCL